MDVVHELVFRHLHVSNGHSQTEHLQRDKDRVKYERDQPKRSCCLQQPKTYLLHLEFNGGLDLVHLGHHVLVVSEQGGELASLVQPRAQDTRNLLDQRLGGQEGVVLLGYTETKAK